MNYAALVAAIQNYTENSFDYTSDPSIIDTFIEQAEQRIYNSVQFPSLRKNVTGTLTSANKYLQAPTPDETYSPVGPDEDQGVVSLGLGYETEHHSIDLGYAYGIFDGRDIENSVNSPDGSYDYDLQVLTLSYGYKF